MNKVNLEWLFEWTFKKRDDPLEAHRIHRYPAVFIPELAEKVIEAFSKEGDLILDIFSGSGTTLLEAMKLNRRAKGIEMNPLAVLIARVKTQYIDEETLAAGLQEWETAFISNSYTTNDITNKEFWFHDTTNDSVTDAVGAIESIGNDLVKDFVKVCLSEIIREVSYCVHSGFKLHKDKKKVSNELSYDKSELLNKIKPVIDRNTKAIIELKDIADNSIKPNIYLNDSRVKLDEIEDGSVDLILTSPPYGDSRTTVAYGQFSTFSSELLKLTNIYDSKPRQLDGDLLGGNTKEIDVEAMCSSSLTVRNIQEIFLGRMMLSKDNAAEKRSRERLKDILSFYDDLDVCIKNASEYLKKEGFFVLVTASRIVHETKLHTDIIIAELAANYDLKLKNIYYRDIHNKRMPRRVSSTNITGETTPTMTEESIIVLQKS